jgi:hypothetical protein
MSDRLEWLKIEASGVEMVITGIGGHATKIETPD